jgi:serine protease Do
MNQVLEAIQEAVRGVAERVGPGVVGLGRGWGRGSGVVIGDGRVLTAAHVLRGDEVTVTVADGRTAAGRVLGARTRSSMSVSRAEAIDLDRDSILAPLPAAVDVRRRDEPRRYAQSRP